MDFIRRAAIVAALSLVYLTSASAQGNFRGDDFIKILRGDKIIWTLDTAALRGAVERWAGDCLDTIRVPLGGYEYVDQYVPGSGGTICDTVCNLYRLVGHSVVELTAGDVAELQRINTMRIGGPNDTCRDRTDWRGVLTLCFEIDSSGGARVDMRQTTEGYPRPCPSSGGNVMCIREDLFGLWRVLRRQAGNPPHEVQFLAVDTLRVPCSHYWGFNSGDFVAPNAMLVMDTVRCWDDSVMVLSRSRQWVAAGRDTLLVYDKCRFPCPEVTFTVTRGAWVAEPYVYEKTRDTIRIDTLICSIEQRLYEIVQGVTTSYIQTLERLFTASQLDSLRSVLNCPVDSISGFRIASGQWPAWRPGYRPYLFGFSDVHWNPSNQCKADSIGAFRGRSITSVSALGIDSLTWSISGSVNPYRNAWQSGVYCAAAPGSSGFDAVHWYVWIPTSTVDSIVGAFQDSCRITRINARYEWGPVCSQRVPFVYYCSGYGKSLYDTLWYDAPDYSQPFVYDTVAAVIYTGEYDTVWTQVFDPGSKTYEAHFRDLCACVPELRASGVSRELCGPFNIVNLCPDGHQPMWVDDTTLAIYASCIDERRVYGMEVDIQHLWDFVRYVRDRDAGLRDTIDSWRAKIWKQECCDTLSDGSSDHNSLTGIQGGAPGDYQHITSSQRALIDSIPQMLTRIRRIEDTLAVWRSLVYSSSSGGSDVTVFTAPSEGGVSIPTASGDDLIVTASFAVTEAADGADFYILKDGDPVATMPVHSGSPTQIVPITMTTRIAGTGSTIDVSLGHEGGAFMEGSVTIVVQRIR
ncbi:MAG TPA: hypothetical protein PK916_04615 [Bacteroidota bacterium]|nr:hypothetical protein [Bacteroidota bacterium]